MKELTSLYHINMVTKKWCEDEEHVIKVSLTVTNKITCKSDVYHYSSDWNSVEPDTGIFETSVISLCNPIRNYIKEFVMTEDDLKRARLGREVLRQLLQDLEMLDANTFQSNNF